MPSQTPQAEAPQHKKLLAGWKWIAVAVPTLVLILAASFSSYFFLAAPIPDRLPAGTESGQTSQNDTAAELEIARLRAEARRDALATGAGFVAIAALILALRRQQHLEQATKNTEADALRRQQHLEHSSANAEDDALQRRITDARIRAVDQLGSDNPAVRIGGLHNLERIGQQHEELRQLVLDEVCSYLRLPFTSPVPKTKDPLPAGQFEPIGPPPKEVQMDEAEGEVRLIAQEILQRHLNPNDDRLFWEHSRLNLRNAHLEGIQFSGCRLSWANFGNAIFSGNAHFRGATFDGIAEFGDVSFFGYADFGDAKFTGDVGFGNTTFERGAGFGNAIFKHGAGFANTAFKRYANLGSATFSGFASFRACLSWCSMGLEKRMGERGLPG